MGRLLSISIARRFSLFKSKSERKCTDAIVNVAILVCSCLKYWLLEQAVTNAFQLTFANAKKFSLTDLCRKRDYCTSGLFIGFGEKNIIKIRKDESGVMGMDTVIDFVQVGNRIREARENQNILQKELAKTIGTSANHLSDIERGKKRASIEMLLQISNALDTPVDAFLKDNPMVCRSYTTDSVIQPLLNQFNSQSMPIVRDMLENMLRLQQANTKPDCDKKKLEPQGAVTNS